MRQGSVNAGALSAWRATGPALVSCGIGQADPRPSRVIQVNVKWEPSNWQLAETSEATVVPATAPQVPLPLPDKPSIVGSVQNLSHFCSVAYSG